MNGPDDRSDDLARDILERAADGGTRCPDDARLAAFVEHRLAPDGERHVRLHLDRCARCREIATDAAAMLRGESLDARGGRPGGAARRLAGLFALAAAAIIVAVVLGGRSPRGGAAPEDLVAAARLVESRHPALLAGLGDLLAADHDPSEAQPLDGIGGAIVAVRPRGRIDDRRPEFAVSAAESSFPCRVVLVEEATGAEIFSAAAAAGGRLAFPDGVTDLEPGRGYLWMAAESAARPSVAPGRARFEIDTAEEAALFRERMGTVNREAPPESREIIAAWLALREGRFEEAEALARASLAANRHATGARKVIEWIRLGVRPE